MAELAPLDSRISGRDSLPASLFPLSIDQYRASKSFLLAELRKFSPPFLLLLLLLLFGYANSCSRFCV